MKLNNEEFRKLIRKESLTLLKKSQAFNYLNENLEEKLEDIEEGFIDRYEKKLESLEKEENKAEEKEEYVTVKEINLEKLNILSRLIAAHQKKAEYLNTKREEIKKKLEDLGANGHGIFKNKDLNEFNNEQFKKNNSVKIDTKSSSIVFKKIFDDKNQYQIINSTAEGIMPGDIVVLPNMKIGSQAKIRVYRKINDKFEELSTPTLSMITNITKNPS